MRTHSLLLIALAALWSGIAPAQDLVRDFTDAYGKEASPTPHLVTPLSMGPVALVGHAKIGADQVFELWTPIWVETQAKVRNGRMSPQEGDARLLAEWEKAILALIKDELFFQEAEREHNSMVNSVIDRLARHSDMPRGQVASEVRRAVEQDMNKFFRQLNADVVQESGGMVKLHKVLESRGLTYVEWQNRLKRKAFTQSYLHMVLKPRTPNPGPRQIQQYYANHPEEFSRPGAVKFRHIFFSNAHGEEKARETAIDVWERLVDGELDFETAVAEYSDDPESKARGGLEVESEAANPEREAWLADVRAALREETPGEISDILESPFGCHIAVLMSLGLPQRVPFQEVRKEIEGKLSGRVWEEETDRYFEAIRKATPIKVLMPAFPASLSCSRQAGLPQRHPRVYSTARPQIHAPRGGQ